MDHAHRITGHSIVVTFLLAAFALSGCKLTAGQKITATVLASCGNNICDPGESSIICPVDCPATNFSGPVFTTYVPSSGVGNIAVMIATPKSVRYPEGAGVVVLVSPLFGTPGGFQTTPDLTSLGMIQISYLWPGAADPTYGISSSGTYDYGGPNSVQVLQDVTRFASGQIPDRDGKYLPDLLPVKPLTAEVGLYAFSDAGIAAVNTLSEDGANLTDVQYFIGRENPTVDALASLEAGYINDSGQPVLNSLYTYPTSYSNNAITLNYNSVRWDPTYTDPSSSFVGRPYFDLDGSGTYSGGDFLLSWRVPVMFGKRYYSVALTQALQDNGSIANASWPPDLATPAEAVRDWPTRETPGRYAALRTVMPQLHVMLVFGQTDSFQAAPDKPHIHQAYQGFRFDAGLWVRLNPDRAYVQVIMPSAGNEFPDNPADSQPVDWTKIGAYAYPVAGSSQLVLPLAAVSEMADRTHFNRWDENLGSPLYIYFPTPTP